MGFQAAACLIDKAFMASPMPRQLFQSIPLYLSSYVPMFPLKSTLSPPSTVASPFPMDLMMKIGSEFSWDVSAPM